jgi:hypothetical protein
MKTRLVSFGALALVVFAMPALAQRPSATSARVTPYVGYMTFGNYVDGPLGTAVRNSGAPLYGVQLGVNLTPNVALVGNAAYASSNLEVGVPILGGLNLGSSNVLVYDAGVQLRLPTGTSTGFVPFVEGGAGAMRTEVTAGPVTAKSTSFAFNYGGGVDLQLTRNIGLRGSVKDYVGKLDLKEVTGLDINTKTTHNWAFSVGLNLGF